MVWWGVEKQARFLHVWLADVIGSLQVYDLADEKPEDVLHQVLGHLEKLKNDGDKVATHVRTHLRIIVSLLVCIYLLIVSISETVV